MPAYGIALSLRLLPSLVPHLVKLNGDLASHFPSLAKTSDMDTITTTGLYRIQDKPALLAHFRWDDNYAFQIINEFSDIYLRNWKYLKFRVKEGGVWFDTQTALSDKDFGKAVYSTDLFSHQGDAFFLKWDSNTLNTPYKAGLITNTIGFAMSYRVDFTSSYRVTIAWATGTNRTFVSCQNQTGDSEWREYAVKDDLPRMVSQYALVPARQNYIDIQLPGITSGTFCIAQRCYVSSATSVYVTHTSVPADGTLRVWFSKAVDSDSSMRISIIYKL